ncbi:hypothetical protein EU546_04405 [Candidatus Thorarchaeota archaeon]|nr:MAG: hypothetical protein EU546_04405 [Candidatus Thorarchaeota archaeon]
MSSYEFTEEENAKIEKLAKYMRIASVLVIVFSILALLFSLISMDLVSGVYFVALIIAGISFYFPTDNFTRIATTEKSDIKELIQGFKELFNFWNIVIVVVVVLLVIELLAFAGVL